ncbi:lipopolysaccharide biosynthesis protein [Streptomyces adelaidensis]|uniref:lipopolysaccharide biosynthesis protein n=1 Tax=Streptomyces adelaidensis TaxID=2796465 RepID=UPI0019044079|nr:lipopolysaccharide biosynthesis protein [Streptomyces adelaidensis]
MPGPAPGNPRGAGPLARVKNLPPWFLLAVGVLLGGALGASYGLVTPATYTATSYVVAVPAKQSDPQAALGFAQAYGRVATQLAVLGDAQVWAGVPVRTLRDSVRTATSPDAPMVAVSATSTRPDLAVDMANAVSRALTRHADFTEDSTHVELQQFARATRPNEASSASLTVTGLVGASAGGLLGGLLLLVRPRRTADSPPLASVPGPATAADAHRHL